MTERQVRVKKAFNGGNLVPDSWEVQARRRWQSEWTILRVYAHKEVAEADATLLRRRVFTDEEKEMMKGAR